jgi:hypothetical protein
LEYQWSKCADDTISFIAETCKNELKQTHWFISKLAYDLLLKEWYVC